MARYCTTVLLGAFLLFQVQPQIARSILPWFGGGAAVWSTCMLFFQVLLLGGYAYAHVLHRKLKLPQQAMVHIALLLCSLVFLPVTPAEHWRPDGAENPSLHILLLLTATVGMPYLLLAATGPLLQAWFAKEFAGRSPYRLYALSNLGSLSALLSFPFLFEPNLTIGVQASAWSGSYVAFVLLCGWCGWSCRRRGAASTAATTDDAATAVIGIEGQAMAAGIATTGRASEQMATVAAVATASRQDSSTPTDAPFPAHDVAIAVAATATSAASSLPRTGAVMTARSSSRPAFVAQASHGDDGYDGGDGNGRDDGNGAASMSSLHRARDNARGAPGPAQMLGWIAYATLPSIMLLAVTNRICLDIAVIPFFWVLPLTLYLVTFILTFEHDRWYRRGVMAPLLAGVALFLFLCGEESWLAGSMDLLVVSFSTCLLLCGMVCHGELVQRRPAAEFLTTFYLLIAVGGALGGLFVALLAPLLFDSYAEVEIGLVACMLAGVIACFGIPAKGALRATVRVVMPFALAVGVVVGVILQLQDDKDYLDRSRNFFGRLTVSAETTMVQNGNRGPAVQRLLTLTHGRTIHGAQVFGDGVEPGQGMTYYAPETGVGYALVHHPRAGVRPLHVGIVGLGAGTLAHYARGGDRFAFYEIDPDVQRLAESRFTYIKDARARGATVTVTLGDARVQLERELTQSSHQFDLLIIDAFSSDAIPVHLLTREAGRLYWKHLATDGVLLIHVSNRHLDLVPIVRGLAQDADKELRIVLAHAGTRAKTSSQWTLMTDNQELLARKKMQVTAGANAQSHHRITWTDDFSSLWHVMDW